MEKIIWSTFTVKSFFVQILQTVPCERRSFVNSGASLRRFGDVTRVAKTDILR